MDIEIGAPGNSGGDVCRIAYHERGSRAGFLDPNTAIVSISVAMKCGHCIAGSCCELKNFTVSPSAKPLDRDDGPVKAVAKRFGSWWSKLYAFRLSEKGALLRIREKARSPMKPALTELARLNRE